MTVAGSTQYVYRAMFMELLPNGDVELLVDLGFEIQRVESFRLINMRSDDPDIRDMVVTRLHSADDIYVKSYKQGNLYFGDITYRIGGEWHNLTIDLTQAVRHNA